MPKSATAATRTPDRRPPQPGSRARTARPFPRREPQEWREHGACRGADPALFFPADKDTARRRAEAESAALALCDQCPVRRICLDHALAAPERYGVWGGMTEAERNDLRRRQRRTSRDESLSGAV